MPRDLTGVRADHCCSYQELEKCAAYVREQLGMSAHEPVLCQNSGFLK